MSDPLEVRANELREYLDELELEVQEDAYLAYLETTLADNACPLCDVLRLCPLSALKEAK